MLKAVRQGVTQLLYRQVIYKKYQQKTEMEIYILGFWCHVERIRNRFSINPFYRYLSTKPNMQYSKTTGSGHGVQVRK